ncbi:hypothetical protein EV2_008019 [Malus domestica]
MGLPDDSTVLILTLIWGSCVVVGKCDIRNSVVTDNKDTKGFSLTGFVRVLISGKAMLQGLWLYLSSFSLLFNYRRFSIPNQEPSRSFGCARYLCRTVSFLLPYQVFQPWIQYMWRRIAYAKHKHVIIRNQQHLKMRFGSLLREDSEPNEENRAKLLYGSATMNNVLFLSVFLALVYFRELMWDFSAEVLIMLIVCVVIRVFCSFRSVFPLWTSSITFLPYPFTISLIYVLDYIFGWS